jgi:hypothetical protein
MPEKHGAVQLFRSHSTFQMGAVTKWTCSGFAAVANRNLLGLGNFEFPGQFAGVQLFMGTVAIRFVGRLSTGAIMFETFCFVNRA